jgi:hypothetical protein
VITKIDAATRLQSIAVGRRVYVAFLAGLVIWIVLITVRGALLVVESFNFPLTGEPGQRFAAPQLLGAAGLAILVCLAAALTTRWVHPTATLPVTCGACSLVLFAAAVSSGSLGPLLLVLTFFGVIWVIGYGVLRRLPSPPADPIVSLPVAGALGLGTGGLLLFLLASFGWLNGVAVSALAVAVLALVLLLDRWRLAAGAMHLRAWRPETPTWFETIVIGVAVGALSFAMLSDFVPEYDSDASRDHLPVVREIWQSGTVGAFPPFNVAQDPVQTHLLYAVAYGLAGEGYAGIAAAKLIHAGVGLGAIVGIAGLGWLCSGRLAAVVGAALFATTPLVLWAVGHAPLDLFPVLFTVAALLCLVHWQRVGAMAWVATAGALAGFGFAAKITMSWVAVALAAAIFLVGRKPWQARERVLAVLVFGLWTIVVIPWLVRSYSITGTVPGHNKLIDLITSVILHLGNQGVPGIAPWAGASPFPDGTSGHSPIAFVQAPWLLTFHANRLTYRTLDISPIGIAPLLLVPVALLAPRTRPVALLAVTAILSYVGWWLTPLQVVRHLLPTLAIVAVLAGVGVASAAAGVASGPRRLLAPITRAVVLVGLVTGLLLFLPEQHTRTTISIDRLIGRETAAEYVAREIPGAAMLAATSELLPPDTLVGYLGAGEYSEIYTEARLLRLPPSIVLPPNSETAPEQVLAFLDRLGVRYFIWDRARTPSEAWHSTLLSTPFLREHSRILAGDGNAYLFAILPGDGLTWGESHPRNLLDNPGLEKFKRAGSPWEIVGGVRAGDGRVWMREESFIAQRVAVSAGTPYLLSASATCPAPDDPAELRLRWMDSDGLTISTAAERVIPGTAGSEQFLWRRAPDQAASVSAELASKQCTFDEATLLALS